MARIIFATSLSLAVLGCGMAAGLCPRPASAAETSATHPSSPAKPKVFRVVVDPGHGGSDQGTVHDGPKQPVMEKDITLLLAKETAKQLRAQGIAVTLTRTTDKELPLGERTALANKIGADAFISIHMNSTHTPMVTDPEGVETYILNNTTDASSRNLARLENTVLGPESRQGNSPEAIDVALILRDLRLDANLPESKRLACMVQDQLVTVTSSASHTGRPKPRNRGVKQALFHVLLGAEMPSILVEAGFLSNPRDRMTVLSPRGRRAIASAIARAVENFRDTRGTPQARATLSRCKVH